MELLHDPLMGHGAFTLLQVRSSDHPLAPRQDQVADHPQEPARFHELVPRVQAKFVELSQEPLMGQGGLDIVQLRSSEPQAIPRHDQVDDPPHDPAIFAVLVPAVQAN